MLRIHGHYHSSEDVPIATSRRFLEVLGRLQEYTLNQIPSNVYLYDLVEQCNIYSSNSLSVLLGYTPAAMESKGSMGFATLIHLDDLERVAAHFQRFITLEEGEVIEIEYRMKHVDGSWHWFRSQDTLLIPADDGFPLQVLGIVQDLTVYQQTEGSADLFSYVLESLQESVMITNLEGVITYVNHAFEQTTGYRRCEVIGKTPAFLKSGQHDVMFYRNLWNTLHSGQTFQAKFNNRHKDGSPFHEDKTLMPLRDRHGKITHYCSLGKAAEASVTPNHQDRQSTEIPAKAG